MLEAPQIPRLNAAQAYALWAPTYREETAVSCLEDQLVRSICPPLARLRLLDVGCGTGRRMIAAGAARATGIEPSAGMIAAGSAQWIDRSDLTIIQGDARALPAGDAGFDVAWCRLVLGHLPRLDQAYAELARVLAPGGLAIVSDFHPVADARGHRRTFRAAGTLYEVENHPHSAADHLSAAETAGLKLVEWLEASVGPRIQHCYAAARRLDWYREQLGMPLVIAFKFEKA
jgi:malonyl-CoA O-methyltransferase